METSMESSWVSGDLDLSQIRLLLFQDCERRGRQVLFDSSTIKKQAGGEEADSPTRCQKSPGISTQSHTQREPSPSYQYTRPSSDVSMFGEMMFGSVAMSYKGSTLKIHHIRSPPQLMVSKVFSARVGSSMGSTNTLHDSFEFASQDCPGHSISSSGSIAHSTPVDMPGRVFSEDGDSGIARSASLATPLASPGSTPSSSSSFQRRLQRSFNTSLEYHTPRSSEERFSQSDESCSSGPVMARRRKIALSIIITLPEDTQSSSSGTQDDTHSFIDFFFSHFPLIEAHLNKLKMAVERAMLLCRQVNESTQRQQLYVSRVMDALTEFRTALWNLFMAPRILEPVWLTMVSQNAERDRLCQRFLQELSALMDTRSGFLSSLLTAVLTHHLAWVPTVTPSNQPPITGLCEKHTSQSVHMLGKTHPYNPLWAQLGDLYGALGSPLRVCRTVVLGRRRDQVQRLLYVLSYFIRCSPLEEHTPTHTPQPQPSPDAHTPHRDYPTHTQLHPSPDTHTHRTDPPQTQPSPHTHPLDTPLTPPSHTPHTQPDTPHTHPIDTPLTPPSHTPHTHPLHTPQTHTSHTNSPHTHLSHTQERADGGSGDVPTWELEGMGLEGGGEGEEGHRVGEDGQGAAEGRDKGREEDEGGEVVRKGEGEEVGEDQSSEDDSCVFSRQPISAPELELPLPRFEAVHGVCVSDLGRSLLGEFSPDYLADFALHGTMGHQHLLQSIMGDLEHAVLYPVLDEPMAEAVCVLADVERVCVQVASSQRRGLGPEVAPSSLVTTLLLSTTHLFKLGLGPQYCVRHLEDCLQGLYLRSRLLAVYLRDHTRCSTKDLATHLGIECEDVALLAAVAGTHTPCVAQAFL